jgi:hypothetical protein
MYSSDLSMRAVRGKSTRCQMRSTDRSTRALRVRRVRFAHADVDGLPGRRGVRVEGWTTRPAFDESITACSPPKTNQICRRSSRSECICRSAPSVAEQTVVVIEN